MQPCCPVSAQGSNLLDELLIEESSWEFVESAFGHSSSVGWVYNFYAICFGDLAWRVGDWPEDKGRMMDQTVALVMAAVTLFGAAIGLRFSVYILIPAGLAVLIGSVLGQVISNKMAEWGFQGTIGLLMLLNAGFGLGLFLRAGAAFWSTMRIARLFARPSNVDQQARRPDAAGRDTSNEGSGPTATMAPRSLAKESFRR